LLHVERSDRLCERLVVVSSGFQRIAAASHLGHNTLNHNGHGLFKPSFDATVSEIGQAPHYALVEE
jgi:hypothetical protein